MQRKPVLKLESKEVYILENNNEVKKNKILIVDDQIETLILLKNFLDVSEFESITARDGYEALEKAQSEKPDLILLDVMMPGLDGYEVCRRIRSNFYINHIPIMFLTCKSSVEDTVVGLEVGGDDYLAKPFDFRELITRINTLLRRTRHNLDANPLTNLPGNVSIQNEIEKLIRSDSKFAVCLIDIDNFKSFNDRYGYEMGDKLIKETASLIVEVFSEFRTLYRFVGHIGGDDFLLTCLSDISVPLCERISKRFDMNAPLYYDKEDRKKGYIDCKSRRGDIQRFPIVSLSIAIVTNELRTMDHPGEISKLLAELKAYAKTFEGSKIVKDRRKN